MPSLLVDKIDMQHRLFARLSEMFATEVPLYDKSLVVNRICNSVVADLLARVFPSFSLSDQQLDRTSGERHGAIRVGRPDEYRWVGRFFACFAMEPHNFYDMANVGAKSQPIIATAFRARENPEHRVFCSLLLTDYFAPDTRRRIEQRLAQRQIYSERARSLIEQAELDGGLDPDSAEALITEGTERIFKWTGQAHDYQLYQELCQAGFKIAADIACFPSHHLNHLTPNSFCIDLYTAAMRFCLGEVDAAWLDARATTCLQRLAHGADHATLRLLFRHLPLSEIESFPRRGATQQEIVDLVPPLLQRLQQEDLRLDRLNHSGFKDSTEGPSHDTPVLLRQDAYKALTEAVLFTQPDGSTVAAQHTARFGEIEQRAYATTPAGRTLYDQCLAQAEAFKLREPELSRTDPERYDRQHAAAFAPFPKTLAELVAGDWVHAVYEPTEAGLAAAGSIPTCDLSELVAAGWVRYEGLRYEDFLPVSAAGIFASNLNQYGTAATAEQRPCYTQADLEQILGRPIIDAALQYQACQAQSILATLQQLQLLDRLPNEQRVELETKAQQA